MKTIRNNRYLLASALLGIVIFLCIFGLEPLRFTGIGWTQFGYQGHDITQHQMGWMFYRNSPWSFPLCKALFLGYPEGTSISYTDSIPLAALFFKVFSAILPENFQYFGLYTCFCFMLQGVFAAALIWIFTENKAFSVIGSVPFITASCFIERCFRHTALSSHWLVLAAMLLYFLRKKKPVRAGYLYTGLLFCAAIGIHPYLFAMVFLIMAVSEAESFIVRRKERKSVFPFILCSGAALLWGFILGLFGTEVLPAKGFGMYSLNLNALFNPTSSAYRKWSVFLRPRNIYASQGEGIYYPGLPILCLTCVIIILFLFYDREAFRKILKNYAGILILSILLTLFAVSNVITFDDSVLAIIPLQDWLIGKLNIFRSSARFFFLPYYLIFLFSAAGLYHFAKKRKAAAVVCCLIISALQIIEMRPALDNMHQYFETRYDYIGLSEDWEELAQKYDTTRTFDCLTNYSLAFWLAKTGLKTDMMITAPIHMDAYWQHTEAERDRLREALFRGTEELDPNTIYIISTETGTNRSFSEDSELENYIDAVRKAYDTKAELKLLTDWVRDYWVLCPGQ